MSEQEIIEGNGIIAKFISKEFSHEYGYLIGNEWFDLKQLKYHSSWDWLMPVIEKIGTIKFPDDIYQSGERVYIERSYPITFGMLDKDGKYLFRLLGFQLFSATTLLEAAWSACVEFIKWHNQNK